MHSPGGKGLAMIDQQRISVSTWSLHRTLGRPAPYGPDNEAARGGIAPLTSVASLLELPRMAADFGIHKMEICHFHIAERTPEYIACLRRALDEAEVELWSLLIDGGDVTNPVDGARDQRWIAGWIETASVLGARHARVIAGKSAPESRALEASKRAMSYLCRYARARDVRLVTENWHALLSTPDAVLALMESQGGELGLCLDFGNWEGESKYRSLAAIAPLAESCHAKCHFDEAGRPDRDDYMRCLDILENAGFDGPYALIYDGRDADEWAGLAVEREMVVGYPSR